MLLPFCLWGCTEDRGLPAAYPLLAHLEQAQSSSPAVEARVVEIAAEERAAIWAHAPATIRFPAVPLGRGARLRTGIGVRQSRDLERADGVDFVVEVVAAGQTKGVWRRTVDPFHRPQDHGWLDVEVDLSPFEGKRVDLVLSTESRENPAVDYSAWSLPVVEAEGSGLASFAKSPIPRLKVVERLDPSRAVRKEIPAGSRLLVSGEAVRQGASKGQLPSPVFRIFLNDLLVFERAVRPANFGSNFSAEIPLAEYVGAPVELRFEVELAADAQDTIRAQWLEALLVRRESINRQPAGSGPNLLFVVVDTLRSDHLSLYGYQRPTSPEMVRLARESMVFDQALSSSSWTMPATASLVTGLYPTEHRVTDGQALLMEIETLADRAQELGMTTLGISANPIVGKAEGFSQGHEQFVHLPWARADQVNKVLLQLLNGTSGLRWYAYVHYIDPHDPYDAPDPQGSMFQGEYHSPFADPIKYRALVKAINFGQGTPSYDEADLDFVRAAYDGEIRYWDDQLGKLLAQLRKLHLLDNTILIITADHGEEFLDHGRLKHGLQLFEESIHVPLLIRLPGGSEASRYPDVVETRRLYDLCLALLDPKSGDPQRATDRLKPRRGLTFAHTEHAVLEGVPQRTTLTAIRDDRWKLLFYPARAAQLELYDLQADPGETRNLAPEMGSTANGYLRLLKDWLAHTSAAASQGHAKDQRILDKLRALGYIQ